MNPHDLENIYAALALEIDAVGKENSAVFLAKLVLLLAHKNADPEDVQESIKDAAVSLRAMNGPT
jgi:hypothetical protein